MRRIVDVPSTADLPSFDYGVATAALSHLFEQAKADTLYTYRQPFTRTWNVWLNHAIDPDTGYRGIRVTLDDFVCAFAAGTLPTQRKEGAA